MNKFLLIGLGLLVAYGTTAQEKREWTFEECITYALDHNIDIRQREQNVEAADNNRQASTLNFTPSLNLNAGYNWNFGLSIDPVTNVPSSLNRQTGNLSLSSQLVLFDGLRNVNQYKQARVDHMAALYNLDAVKNDVAVNVASSYLQVLMNKEIYIVSSEQYNNSVRMFEQAQRRYDAGAIAEGDLLQAESQMASDEQRMVVAENNVAISRLQLAQLLQLEDPSSFDIGRPEFDLPAGAVLTRSPMDIYTAAREIQPVVQASEMNVQSAELQLAQSRGRYYPTLSLTGAISTNYSDRIPVFNGTTTVVDQIGYWDDNGTSVPVFTSYQVPVGQDVKAFDAQVTDNLNEFIGFNLNWPIYSRFQIRNDVRAQKLNLESAELEQERVENQLLQTIQRAHADAQASLKSYDASTKAVEAAELSLEYARIRRDEGAISQFEFDNARNNYLAAKSQQLQSKYDYIFKIRVLEFYLNNQF